MGDRQAVASGPRYRLRRGRFAGGLWSYRCAGLPFFGHKSRREREWEEVRAPAQDDLVALGDDIRSLDVDVQMPSVSAEATQRYEQALEAYQRAREIFDRAKRPEDLAPVPSASRGTPRFHES